MINWKKAIGTGLTATMLASLLATAAVGTALAVVPTCAVAPFTNGIYGTQFPYCTDATERPADGASFITLKFAAPDAAVGYSAKVVVTTSSGTFSGGTGSFAPASIVGTYPSTAVTVASVTGAVATDSTLQLTAPTTAGTPNVTVSYVPLNNATTVNGVITPPNGVAITDSIQSFTWTAAASKVPSVTNTTNNFEGISASGAAPTDCSGAAAVSAFAKATVGSTLKALCTLVRDGDGNLVTTGVKVKYTISGPGSIGAAGTGTVTDSASPFFVEIFSSGISGEATIKTTITYLNVDYALPDKTFTFYGDPSAAVLSANVTSVVTGCASDDTTGSTDCPIKQDAHSGLRLLVTDAAGTKVRDLSGWTLTWTVTPANLLTIGTMTAYSGNYPGFAVPYTCGSDALQGTVSVKIAKGTTTVTTGTVNISCVDALASSAVGSFTIGATATSLVPGGNTTITVTVKDDNGFPAADGTVVTAAANAGAVVSSDGNSTAKTSAGVAKFTYLAPSTAGAATVTAFVSNAGGPNSVTLSIGGATPPPAGPVTWAPTQSALGNTLTGPFSFATKIQSIGGYITWKVDGGTGMAGQTIQVWVYKKYSPFGVWAGPTMLTTRKANASGVAYINIHTGGILWLSLRPVLPATATQAASWGPTSIGRWR